MSNIFCINSGSSSIKLSIYEISENNLPELKTKIHVKKKLDSDKGVILASGSSFTFNDWYLRFHSVLNYLIENNFLSSDKNIVIHRFVHGFDDFRNIVKVDKTFIKKYTKLSRLISPLHDCETIKFIELIIQRLKKNVIQYVCFDTSFGSSIPEVNYLYSLPEEFGITLGIRKYLFHGISYKYILSVLNRQNSYLSKKIVICHLGHGSSVCAISKLQPVDSSFGFTPLQNLITSTRIGEFDVNAYMFLKKFLSKTDKEIFELLSRKSGLLGISAISSDMEKLINLYNIDSKAKLAVDMYLNMVTKYIFQMVSSLNGIDVLIFSGGIGENSSFIRQKIADRLSIFFVYLNQKKNENIDIDKDIYCISQKESKVEVFVIKSDECQQMIHEYLSIKDI